MMKDKIRPETLLQLMTSILSKSTDFEYIRGVQPFLMSYKGRMYYVYVKNLSSAYFKERPDTTRAQLPIKEEFNEIKTSPFTFIFFGYDGNNDVLVCWNFHIAKKRLNEKKSVSFYSRRFYQEEVVAGEFLRKKLKNDDVPVFFKRRDLIAFFDNIDKFFDESANKSIINSVADCGKIISIKDADLLAKLKPLLATSTPHTLEAIKLAHTYYGEIPTMKFRDWANLIKTVTFND